MGEHPNFDMDLETGEVAEHTVRDILALSSSRIEVKHDRLAHRTGNLYVEVGQKPYHSTEWKDSGLRTTQAQAWVFVLVGLSMILVPTDTLKDACHKLSVSGNGPVYGGMGGDNPTSGYLVPIMMLFGP